MRVTMNIFSGRPNPAWRLTRQQAAEFLERLAAGAAPVPPEEPPVLGFRGFTVEGDIDDPPSVPGVLIRVVVPPPAPAVPPPKRTSRGHRPEAVVPPARDAASQLSEFLLETARQLVPDDVMEAAQQSMEYAAGAGEKPAEPSPAAAEAEVSLALASPVCEPFVTPIQPLFWNNPPVRFRNNCYNYASNFVSNTLAQPGRRSGRQYTAFNCGNVAAAAHVDGYEAGCSGTMRVVALGIWPGLDFHWWRLHPNGFWAHKIGTSPVFVHDNRGRLLGNGLTPQNCDRGPYVQFCGFFFGPLGLHVL